MKTENNFLPGYERIQFFMSEADAAQKMTPITTQDFLRLQ